MAEYHQCYYQDSGMIFRQRKIEDPPDPLPEDYVPPPPWVPYENRPWFDPAVHAAVDVVKDFPADREKRPYFYIPALGVIEDNVDADGRQVHPLLKALRAQFPNGSNWEDLEDLIESKGGLRRAIEQMDIGRLGRRVKRMYQAGDITTDQVQKIKAVFQHLTSDFD